MNYKFGHGGSSYSIIKTNKQVCGCEKKNCKESTDLSKYFKWCNICIFCFCYVILWMGMDWDWYLKQLVLSKQILFLDQSSLS